MYEFSNLYNNVFHHCWHILSSILFSNTSFAVFSLISTNIPNVHKWYPHYSHYILFVLCLVAFPPSVLILCLIMSELLTKSSDIFLYAVTLFSSRICFFVSSSLTESCLVYFCSVNSINNLSIAWASFTTESPPFPEQSSWDLNKYCSLWNDSLKDWAYSIVPCPSCPQWTNLYFLYVAAPHRENSEWCFLSLLLIFFPFFFIAWQFYRCI